MTIVYVTVRVEVSDNVDPQDVINECDYDFTHKDIGETEIVGAMPIKEDG